MHRFSYNMAQVFNTNFTLRPNETIQGHTKSLKWTKSSIYARNHVWINSFMHQRSLTYLQNQLFSHKDEDDVPISKVKATVGNKQLLFMLTFVFGL